MVDIFEKPELRLARVSLRDHRKSEIFWELHCKCNSTRSFSLRSRGLLENIYDSRNVIRLKILIKKIYDSVQRHSLYQVVFVTLDAGERLSDKKEEKRPERKAIKKK